MDNERIARLEAALITAQRDAEHLREEVAESRAEMRKLEATCRDAVQQLAARLILTESQTADHKAKWEKVWDYTLKLGWCVAIAYLLTRFNLQSPAVP